MSYTLNAVVAETFAFPDFTFTMHVTGNVVASDVGKAVALDATKSNAVKLAGDGDTIYGRLETFEKGGLDGLVVGAISRKFRAPLPIKAGLAGSNIVANGDTVVGAGDGFVKAANDGSDKTADPHKNTVVALNGSTHAVVELL